MRYDKEKDITMSENKSQKRSGFPLTIPINCEVVIYVKPDNLETAHKIFLLLQSFLMK